MSGNKPRHELDTTDRTILRLLQQDGALSNPKLAEQLSLSVTPCWRRLKRLEDEGYIKDYQANLDRRKLGYDVLAFVSVSFAVHADEAPNRFEEAIRDRPEVLACHKITGAADYLLQVVAENLDGYSDFVENVLRKMPGVHSIQSSLALREVKSSSRLPVPD
ncbi:transcriptional regulator, AsnC family [Pseudogulbenkiania sp. NH8B]|uniref:Transcriptional regulator, AsnC family n=1 Tax=Pseudogulbenkiania ferrooxidans 2002 TaxID=279714 RepID=B9Z488_9NEIS|nr:MULTISPECIES: Lrp/AsnC family transcriptional regulator [Pseudogulbenkiania]EEG08665.1 transcriptional regulator, AsnC family [Pseudogulbenkiania ferrooxidans 2002]BAK76873.1 transcriptional regulator, AsnC family [Pseudogulbenkiania sp. NH8B]